MENKKLSLAELKAKANAVNTAEALNATLPIPSRH
jgi:hypothetical protein